ncbi:MAG: hypothetical protein QOJ32_3262 [Frankiaceae bacterium]|nr:hypothetical protein [Frankiaceae bacterium]
MRAPRPRPSRARFALGVLVLLGGLAACGSAGAVDTSGKLRVIATTTQVADFARQVGGDRAVVTGLLHPNVDPHDFEPSPADLTAINRAAVVVENGVGLEHWLDGALSSAGYSGPVVDTSGGIRLRANPEGGSAQDPHIWQDPRNAKLMVATIRDAFVAADPTDAAAYRANADRYLGQLNALDAEVAREIASIPPANRRVVTDHDAFGYFFDRYGLTFVGSVIPTFDTSAELSGSALADLVAKIRAQHVPAVFAEASLPPRTAQTVAAEAGVRVIAGDGALYGDTLGPAGSPGATYLGMVAYNTRTFVAGLRG